MGFNSLKQKLKSEELMCERGAIVSLKNDTRELIAQKLGIDVPEKGNVYDANKRIIGKCNKHDGLIIFSKSFLEKIEKLFGKKLTITNQWDAEQK